MTNLEKAQEQLEGCGVQTNIENNTLYVYVDDIQLEIAEFEINFRAKLYDESNESNEVNKTYKQLNEEFGKLSEEFKNVIEDTVRKILKEHDGVSIRFKEAVFTHLISDNCYSDCRGIQLDQADGKSLIYQIERHMDGDVDEYDETIDEMDLSSYYELLLALNEKSFVVEKEL